MTMRYDEMTRSAATLAGLCGVVAAGLTASCFSDRSTAVSTVCEVSPCIVDIRDFAFQPGELRIRAGMTVRWVNGEQQIAHTSTSDDGLWDSPLLAPGQNFSRAFPTAGRFPYHCEPHPNMTAAIVVE